MFFGSGYEKERLQRQRLTGGLGRGEPYNVSAYDGGVADSVEPGVANAEAFSSKYPLTLKNVFLKVPPLLWLSQVTDLQSPAIARSEQCILRFTGKSAAPF
jgi:hypothetical protein